MKSLNKFFILALALTLSFASFSSDLDDPNSQSVKQAKEAVKLAEPDDYITLAQSAEICFLLKENTEQALSWIDQSLNIKETPYNLEIKADFLASIGDKSLATNYYLKAVLAADESSLDTHNSRIQDKLLSLR
ncbi:hypothetical protein [Marinoscillum sp. MHG1-6]|uniref:hypothetical protein n=1 Tax=Marinoscillum sp. MHG1-6 TaxID=2959627 RepID=UPI0021571323|nr:hypothetical protein [Marinoscillum sp. MHG1-6]